MTWFLLNVFSKIWDVTSMSDNPDGSSAEQGLWPNKTLADQIIAKQIEFPWLCPRKRVAAE